MSELDNADDVLGVMHTIARIAHAMDGAPTVSDLIDLVADDIRWSFAENPGSGTPASTIAGADALAEWAGSRRASGNQGPDSGNRHVVSTMAVDLTGPDAGRSRSYFCFYGRTDAGPVLSAVGTYDDEWTRTDGGWRLAARRIQL